jgi:hypothetical protein
VWHPYPPGGFTSKRGTMVKLTVLYEHPDDPDAFEDY